MKSSRGVKPEHINAVRVFTENEQVFMKKGTEDWFPVPFHWTKVIVQ
ncbi:MAG: hypothetical protein AB3N14_02035 [Flavobacteriaceae bacterium]